MSTVVLNNDSGGSSSSSGVSYQSLDNNVEGQLGRLSSDSIEVATVTGQTRIENIENPAKQQEGVPSIANNLNGISRPISRGEDSCFKDCVAACGSLCVFLCSMGIGMGVGSIYGRSGIAVGAVVGIFGGLCGVATYMYVLKKTHYNGYV